MRKEAIEQTYFNQTLNVNNKIIISGLVLPEGLTFGKNGTGQILNQIEIVNFNVQSSKLFFEPGQPRALALYSAHGYMHWTDLGGNQVGQNELKWTTEFRRK